MTESELFASFVTVSGYLERVDLAAAGGVTAVNGIQLVVCDTSGGGFTVTLDDPGPDDAPERWNPIVVNVGTNTLTVDTQTASINGQAGTQDIVSQYGALDLHHNGTDFQAAIELAPVIIAPPLTSIPSLQVEYDFQDAETAGELWSDTARSVDAVDGDAVTSLDASFSASGDPRADQTTGANRPTVNLGNFATPPESSPDAPNGRASLNLTGATPWLETDWHELVDVLVDTPIGGGILEGDDKPFSIAFVAEIIGAGAIFGWLGSASLGDTYFYIRATALDIEVEKDGDFSSPVTVVSASPYPSGFATYIFTHDGTTISLTADGVSLITAAAMDTTRLLKYADARTVLGAEFDVSEQIDNEGNLRLAAISFFDAELSAGEQTTVLDYYNQRFGL